MNQVLEILIHKVHNCGGTVNQLYGSQTGALRYILRSRQTSPRTKINIQATQRHHSRRIPGESQSAFLRDGSEMGSGAVGEVESEIKRKLYGSTIQEDKFHSD